jgi:uncharacterized protein (TIRG00374 family)
LKNRRLGWVGAGVSIAIIAAIAARLDYPQLVLAFATARYIYLLPCIGLLLLGLVTRALRWRVLLSGGLTLRRAFSIMNAAYLVNGVLPLRIGELARIYLATQVNPPVPVMKTTSTIIAERLLDLLAVSVMALTALAFAPLRTEIRTAALILGPLGIVGFLVLVLLARFRQRPEQWVMGLSERFPLLQRVSLVKLTGHFLDGVSPLAQARPLALALGFTVLSWGISTAAGYVLMFAFYDQPSVLATMLYIAAAAYAIAFPALPGSVGTYEGAILIALDTLGYSVFVAGQIVPTALSFAVMVHAVNLMVHIGTGLVGFIQEGVSLRQLSDGIQQMNPPTSQDAIS